MEDLCREYLERTRRHVPIEVNEVDKAAGLLRGIPAAAEIIALEPGGACWTTDELKSFVESRMTRGARALVFLIGGAEGLPREVVDKAQRRLSLSPLTLPHRLARVILCEQLYRCISSIRGEPYCR